jgi:EpsI family protein
MREYKNTDGSEILFTVVFSHVNRRVSHPPELCLMGGGWSRTNKDIQKFSIGDDELRINRLIIEKGSEKDVVMYLYKSGSRLTPNYYAQQLGIVINSALRRSTSSALIRFSCPIVDGDIEGATEQIERFAREAIPVLKKSLP